MFDWWRRWRLSRAKRPVDRLVGMLRGEDVEGFGMDAVGHPVIRFTSGRAVVLKGVLRSCPRCHHTPDESKRCVEIDLVSGAGVMIATMASADRLDPEFR